MKRFPFVLLILFTSLLIFSSGCSQLLNEALVPFAPDFVPEIDFTSKGAEIRYSLSSTKKVSKDDSKTWSQDFAVYIWRSTVSPYQDYELIKRIYWTDLAREWTGYYTDSKGKTTYKKYDFSIPNSSEADRKRNIKDKSSGTIIDDMPLTTTCFYRVTKVKFSSSHSSTDKTDSLSYSLSDETSGWVSSEKKD